MSDRTADVIVVGSGSAGAVVSRRLADAGARVLLLEAGGRDDNPAIHDPGRVHELWLSEVDWAYVTVPQSHANRRRLAWPRGKVLGGSSCLNAMIWVRGAPEDFDTWAYLGADGWSWDDVRPVYERLESELQLLRSFEPDPIHRALAEAAQECGIPLNPDYNGETQDGVSFMQYTIRDGVRHSTMAAFLRDANQNLEIVTDAQAERLLFVGTRCVGVEWATGSAHAGLVVVSGGTVGSAELLLRSGIGPADHLRATGIAPVLDAPEVGGNLQDHLAVTLWYMRREPGTFRALMRADRAALAIARAYLFGTGPATMLPGGVTAFLKTQAGLAVPDIQFFCRGTALDADLWFPGWKPAYEDGFSLSPVLLHPVARGRRTLRSADPRDKVRIVHNFLADEADLRSFRAGVRIAREVVAQAPLDRFRGAEKTPGAKAQTDAEIDAWIRRTARSAHHPSCTCAMGRGGVLDPQLRVRGIDKLRVVDASAMPDLVTGNINGCVLAIAEKASDMILGRKPLTLSFALRAPAL